MKSVSLSFVVETKDLLNSVDRIRVIITISRSYPLNSLYPSRISHFHYRNEQQTHSINEHNYPFLFPSPFFGGPLPWNRFLRAFFSQ